MFKVFNIGEWENIRNWDNGVIPNTTTLQRLQGEPQDRSRYVSQFHGTPPPCALAWTWDDFVYT
jgi:hypothetical protein